MLVKFSGSFLSTRKKGNITQYLNILYCFCLYDVFEIWLPCGFCHGVKRTRSPKGKCECTIADMQNSSRSSFCVT